MIEAIFTVTDKVIQCFEISGHSDYSEEGSDIICAAVSSAAYMTANTLTEVLTEVQSLAAEITEQDGLMKVSLSPKDAKAAEIVLNGFLLHLNALSEQYKDYIKVKISEV